jgi:hypothetical protein
LLLFLGFILLVLVTIDLDTDLSTEKNEIEYVIGTLTPVIHLPDLNLQSVKDFTVPCTGIINVTDDAITNRIYYNLDHGRGPPHAA